MASYKFITDTIKAADLMIDGHKDEAQEIYKNLYNSLAVFEVMKLRDTFGQIVADRAAERGLPNPMF